VIFRFRGSELRPIGAYVSPYNFNFKAADRNISNVLDIPNIAVKYIFFQLPNPSSGTMALG
jgi:hypothetical protein